MEFGNPLDANHGISVVFNSNVMVNAIYTSLVILYPISNEFDLRL